MVMDCQGQTIRLDRGDTGNQKSKGQYQELRMGEMSAGFLPLIIQPLLEVPGVIMSEPSPFDGQTYDVSLYLLDSSVVEDLR